MFSEQIYLHKKPCLDSQIFNKYRDELKSLQTLFPLISYS